jgi:hypothetical protein
LIQQIALDGLAIPGIENKRLTDASLPFMRQYLSGGGVGAVGGCEASETAITQEDRTTIYGHTVTSGKPDADEVISFLVKRQEKVQAELYRKHHQVIHVHSHLPIALTFMADPHEGDPYTDYRSLERDTEIIRTCPGMKLVHLGDLNNNWIVSKLRSLQDYQPIPRDEENALVERRLRLLAPSMIGIVIGNHNAWTKKMGGVDNIRTILSSACDATRDPMLYDSDELYFELRLGDGAAWPVMARHKWRGNSIVNPFAGIMNGLRIGNKDYVIGVGGHLHTGNNFATWDFLGKKRMAYQLASYKLFDGFGEECGFPETVPEDLGRGSAAVILYPNGEWRPIKGDLAHAADELDNARCKWKK